MLRLRKSSTVLLPILMLTGVRAAHPQTVSQVTVNGTNYSVTPMSRGRMARVDDADGHMIGMASINGATISVLAPQQEPGFTIVKSAVNAYLHPANGSALAAPSPAPDITPRLIPPASTVPGVAPSNTSLAETIVFPAGGGAIVHGTAFGDITYSADGTEARAVQKSSNGLTGETTVELIARYMGGDNPGKGKAAGIAGGGAKVLFESMNVRAKGTVNTRGNDEVVVSQRTNGGKEAAILGTGDKKIAESPYTPRDLNAGNRQRGDGFLRTAYQGLQDATDEAAKRRTAGEAVSFDPAGTPAGQNALREYARYEKQ